MIRFVNATHNTCEEDTGIIDVTVVFYRTKAEFKMQKKTMQLINKQTCDHFKANEIDFADLKSMQNATWTRTWAKAGNNRSNNVKW